MNHALVDTRQTVRFLADAFNLVDLDVPPLEQPSGLPVAGHTERVSTFCLWVKFVFGHNVTVGFYTSSLPCSAVTVRCDSEPLFRMLVDPFLFEPFPRVGIVRRNKMKLFGVDTFRVPKRDYVCRLQKIERFNLFCIGLTR